MSRVHRVGVIAGPRGAGGGQQLFTASGTFVVPAGVTSICVVTIGPGGPYFDDDGAGNVGSGGGGALSYVNALSVTPGESLAILVAPYDLPTFTQGQSRLRRGGTTLVSANSGGIPGAGTVGAGTGFNGGQGAYSTDGSGTMEGAGAGGYTSAGQASNGTRTRRGGGGSDPLGGSTGALAGASANLNGVNYGGGAAYGGTPGLGCVRIIWGAGRAFPNTNTGDV